MTTAERGRIGFLLAIIVLAGCAPTLDGPWVFDVAKLDGVLLREVEAEVGKPIEQRAFGLASAFVLAHLEYRDRGVSPGVRQACAPVAVDIRVFLARVGAIGAPGGGALNFLLPLL